MSFLLIVAALAAEAAAPVPLDAVDAQPRLLSKPRLEMPEDALRAGAEGKVVVEITVTETGETADAHIIESIPLLDATALENVRRWRFEPARKDGRAVATKAMAEVSFRLDPDRPLRRRADFITVPDRAKGDSAKLLKKLGDKRAEKRAEAALHLAALPEAGPEVTSALRTALGDPDPRVRDRAAVALFRQDTAAFPVDEKPSFFSHRQPEYPKELREAKVEGRVRLEVLVSESGHVLNARYVESAGPKLDEEALITVSRWVYLSRPEQGPPGPFITRVSLEYRDGLVNTRTRFD
jgi:TonB family protein